MDQQPKRRILVVGPSWVGDMVMAQALFKLLHARHAGLALDVLAPRWTFPILERMPEVRRAIESPFGHGDLRLGERRRLGRSLAAEGYDQAIVLPRSFKAALVPLFARIPVRTGYIGELRHWILNDARKLDERRLPQMAQRFAALGLPRGEPLRLPLPALKLRVDEGKRRALLERFELDRNRPAAALCPGAEYGPAKRWPARYFGELAQGIAARGCAVWLIGSRNDREAAAEVERSAGGVCRNLCGETTLAEAIDLVASASLVVSNDSGLMHVAAALGKPLVALYGSTSPDYTPPLSPSAHVLKLDLPCSPCFQRECPLGHFNCMMQLAPGRVLAEIDFDRIS
jgi:heptosyltransferase-2